MLEYNCPPEYVPTRLKSLARDATGRFCITVDKREDHYRIRIETFRDHREVNKALSQLEASYGENKFRVLESKSRYQNSGYSIFLSVMPE